MWRGCSSLCWDEVNEEHGSISEKGKIFKVIGVKKGQQRAPEYESSYLLSSPTCGKT